MTASKILNGKDVAEFVYQRNLIHVESLKSQNVVPGLVVVLVGDDPASAVYVRSKGKMCQKLGIFSETHTLPAETSQSDVLALISRLNNDKRFNGILVQSPLPQHINEQKIIEAINPAKDVDCFHPQNVGLLTIGAPYMLPCTPAGIIEILKYYKLDTNGKDVVIIGRSNIVGKPMANMLIQKAPHANATVTVVHSRTKDLKKFTQNADIVIAAIGVPEFLKADMIKEGAIIIDVGINRVDDETSPKGYVLKGDVAYSEVYEKASCITPVPGGVGPMTIGMLMRNTIIAAANQNGISAVFD